MPASPLAARLQPLKQVFFKLVAAALGAFAPSYANSSELVIYPSRVVVSADYAARVIVLERRVDGTTIDRTRDAALKLAIPNSLPLNWDPVGELRVNDHTLEQSKQSKAAQPSDEAQKVRVSFGKLTSQVEVVLGSTENESPAYAREITALLGKSGCNLGTCHGNLHGKGGFRLSLRGDDPLVDYSTIVRGSGARRVDFLNPAASLLIRKPLGQVAHQGGVRFGAGSAESRMLERWVAEGCQWNAKTGAAAPAANSEGRPDETLIHLSVYPSIARVAKSHPEQQLVVLATFADGVVRDVTRWSRFEASEVTGVTINNTGLVQAQRPIDLAVSVSYLSGRTAARLTFLPHDHATWSEPASPTQLDALVDAQLASVQLQPSSLAPDSTFLRRIYLVTVGRLPSAQETREFLIDTSGDKRQRLIEKLLNDRGYAQLWAMRWSDLLRNEQKVMSSQGADTWHAWMLAQVATDRPLNDFVAEMLTTVGSTYDHPPASFHRTHRDPETAAESIGQVFLGVRLQCARCHNHPFDNWRQDDYYGLAAYFTTLDRKQVSNDPKDKFDKHIISGDEIISLAKKPAAIWHPGRAEDIAPKPLDQPFKLASAKNLTLEKRTAKKAEAGADADTEADTVSPLEPLARWLTQNNRMFARNMANRIWYHVMGRGIVDPPDDFRDSNPPSNPALLEYLTDELIRSGYSTRHLTRLILSSQTFARSAAHEPDSENPLSGIALFAGYPLHRMPAEVLFDALSDVTGVPSELGSREELKGTPTTESQRAVARADVPTRAGFLTAFGKPGRMLVCECERSSETSLGQSLILVNGVETREKLSAANNRLSDLLKTYAEALKKADAPTQAKHDDVRPEKVAARISASIIEELYLSTLTRMPTATESSAMVEYFTSAVDRRLALEDMLWALVNSKEFALIQ